MRIDGKECILVRFEGYNTPYFAYDVARIRVADEDKVLSQQELVAYLRKQDGAEDAWERRVSNFLVEQVDGKLVERYIERGHEAKRIEFEYADKTSALNKLLLTEKEYREMCDRYGDEFEAAMGAEAVQTLLKEIDLDQLSAELTAEVEKSSGQKRVRILKRLEVVEAFRISGNRPEWMVMDVLPVLPPDLRPMAAGSPPPT